MADFSARGWARIPVGTVLSTLFCITAALAVDSLNFANLSDAARLRSILTDIGLPIILAGPLTFFFLTKLRALAIAKQKLEMTLDAIAQGISFFDANQRLTVWNARYAELFDMDLSELGPETPFLTVLELQRAKGNFAGEAAALQERITQKVKLGLPFANETILASGRRIWSTHMPTPDGGWVATHDDVTVARRQQTLLAAQNDRLATVLGNVRQGVCMFDESGRLVTANQQFLDLYRLSSDVAHEGADLAALEWHLLVDGLLPLGGSLQGNHVARGHDVNSEQTLQLQDGRAIRVVSSRLADGGSVSTHEDVTERRRIEAQLEHDSLHDALTELPNRRFLDRELKARTANSGQQSGLGLLHIDIDRFKQINDTMGHTAGDAVLRHVARVLKDVVDPNDFVARVGGDEFVVVSRSGGEDNAVVGLAQAIIGKMRTPLVHGGGHFRVGVSIGLAVESPPIIDAERLLVSADLALNQAKVGGRGRFERYDPAMLVRIVNSRQMTDELILAVERKEFITHFQPKVDARSRAIVGVEALVRWQHPRLGLLPPSQFLTIAEELNLLAEIDDFVLTETLGQLAKWREQGLGIQKASVNISSRRLRDSELCRRLTELRIPRGAVSFELLESIDLDHLDDVVSWNIEQAREMGIGIEVDDFGTGRASMLALSRLRPDKLKIDRQFVSAMGESAEQQKLVGWMIEIAHALGVTVIAEGVEDLHQAELLTGMGCNELQGYAFGRPMSGDQMTTLLTAGDVPASATA